MRLVLQGLPLPWNQVTMGCSAGATLPAWGILFLPLRGVLSLYSAHLSHPEFSRNASPVGRQSDASSLAAVRLIKLEL